MQPLKNKLQTEKKYKITYAWLVIVIITINEQ